MAVPKKKTSKSQRNLRKKTWKQKALKQFFARKSYFSRKFYKSQNE